MNNEQDLLIGPYVYYDKTKLKDIMRNPKILISTSTRTMDEKSQNNGEDSTTPVNDEEREAETSDLKINEQAALTPPVKQKPRGLWGTAAKLASKSKVENEAADSPRKTLRSVAKRVNRQIKAMSLIKRWTQMTSLGQFAKDEEHLNYIRDITKQTGIDIPAPLEACIREEVLGILQDTLKQYRIELGTNHPLTQEMQTKIQELKEQVVACIPKENRRDTFFKKISNVFLPSE